MAAAKASPVKLAPQISISPVPPNGEDFPAPPDLDQELPTFSNLSEALVVSNDAERYYTASSGDEAYDEDSGNDIMSYDYASDDEGDNESLSGLQINLKTLQAVSTMLAHYRPIIQRDEYGHPIFVAPPPPPLDEYDAELSQTHELCRTSMYPIDSESSSQEITDSDSEINIALQELEDVITAEEHDFLNEKMNELSGAMQKMQTCYTGGDEVDDIPPTSSF